VQSLEAEAAALRSGAGAAAAARSGTEAEVSSLRAQVTELSGRLESSKVSENEREVGGGVRLCVSLPPPCRRRDGHTRVSTARRQPLQRGGVYSGQRLRQQPLQRRLRAHGGRQAVLAPRVGEARKRRGVRRLRCPKRA
jgi:hypothetical protein